MAKKNLKIDRDTKIILGALAGIGIVTAGAVVLVDRTESRVEEGAARLLAAVRSEIQLGEDEVRKLAQAGYAGVAQLEAALYSLAAEVVDNPAAKTAMGLADDLKRLFLGLRNGARP